MDKLNKLYKFWCNQSQILRFFIIGCVNAGISYIIFAAALWIAGVKYYQFAVFVQWTVSSVFSYFNQKFFVFCTVGNYLKEYLKCCTTWGISYVLNVVILEILMKTIFSNDIRVFTIPGVYIAQFISIFLVSVSTYILFKCFAFKNKN